MDVVGFGRGVRALRVRRRWRQEDLAREAHVSRSVVARVEQGRGDRVTVATLDRVLAALGARLICRIDWHGQDLDRLLDRAHAEIVEQLVRILRADGWLCATEVSFNVFGERGSVDILAFHPGPAMVLVVEVKTAIGDVQATFVALDRKGRLALTIAKQQGWEAKHVGRLLAVRDTSTVRRRVSEHSATFGTAFPQRTVAVRQWLRQPNGPLSGLWFVSSRSVATAPRRVRRPAADAVG